MNAIKPIETTYNGYRFRSRLEARWAVFFDAVNIRYEYEPEGFELFDRTKYLPDFYLPDADIYIEIKGIGALTVKIVDDGVEFFDGREKAEKYMKAASAVSKNHTYMILCGDPYDIFYREHGGNGEAHVFFTGHCLGKLFSEADNGYSACEERRCIDCDHPLVNRTCYYFGFLGFTENAVILFDTEETWKYFPKKCEGFEYVIMGNPVWKSLGDKTDKYLLKNLSAAKKARQARFEHGENGLSTSM